MTDISEEIQVTLRIFSFMTLNIYLKRKEKVKILFHVYLSKRKKNAKKSRHHSDPLTVCVIMYYEFPSNIIAFLEQLKIFLKILLDAISEMWTEMTDIVVFRKKLQKFLQGVLCSLCSVSY